MNNCYKTDSILKENCFCFTLQDMLKTAFGLIFFLLSCSFAFAQKTDSLKADTNFLNRYRLDPRKNALPIRIRPLQIIEEPIPVQLLDYKVSYWHRNIIFGLNFNQSVFSNNWSAGGISSVALGTNFDFKEEIMRVIPVWVRLPNLPLHC